MPIFTRALLAFLLVELFGILIEDPAAANRPVVLLPAERLDRESAVA